MRDDGHPEKQLLQLESASFQAFGTGKSTGGSNHAVQGIPFEVSVARLSLAERKDISGYRQEDVRSICAQKVVVPSTHTAENHDFIFLTMGEDHQPQIPCSALRAQAICRVRAPCTHALTDLLSPMNQSSPLDDSCGSLCFRYCHVLPSIVFQVYLFSGFQFFKYYG